MTRRILISRNAPFPWDGDGYYENRKKTAVPDGCWRGGEHRGECEGGEDGRIDIEYASMVVSPSIYVTPINPDKITGEPGELRVSVPHMEI